MMRSSSFETVGFDKKVAALLEDWKVPGLAIAIIDDQQSFVKTFGYGNLEKQIPITDSSLFDCASTTKSFTAACVALCIEDHNEAHPIEPIGFDTPVSKLLPEDFILADPEYTENVTIEDILSHRTGLPGHELSAKGIKAEGGGDDALSITRNMRNLPIAKPLRTRYMYNNLMYTVASYLVEKLSGKPFPDFIKERIWKPLDMNDTWLNLPGLPEYEILRDNMAIGYVWDEEKEEYRALPFWSQPEGQGQGSIFSSVSEYAKWIRCMMHQALPLSKYSHEELIKPRIIERPESAPKNGFSHTLYALGWEVESYRGHRLIGHDGCVWGFGSLMKYLPEHKWGVVIMGNGNEGCNSCLAIIAMQLIDKVLELPEAQRQDWAAVIREAFDVDLAEEREDEQKEDEFEDDPDVGPELPLEAYVGAYQNTGYHTYRFELRDGRLLADCTDRGFPYLITLQRIEGKHFQATLRDALDGTSENEGHPKVRFELDSEGRSVKCMGLDLEEGEMVWFEHI